MKLSILLFLTIVFSHVLVSQGIPPREETKLDEVYDVYKLSGQGVLVVMIDRGIDYTHPAFIDENGQTRLAYIYDMIDPTGANDPNNPYGVGTIFDAVQINQSLANNDPPLSTDRFGHGTATTSIICGNGRGTAGLEFQGVAPKATIISIKLTRDAFPPFDGEPGQTGFFNPTYIPIALQFARDKIEELGMPSVTLMNIGSVGGPTDGSSLICRKIDEFVQAGNPFVCGVGDDGGNNNHASGSVAANETIEIEINKGETGNLRFDLWYSEDDRFTVSVERPNGFTEGPFAAPGGPSEVADHTLDGIFLGHRGADVEFFEATSNRRELLIDFNGDIGVYKVILEGTQISDGSFHATLNPSVSHNNNRFLTHVTPGYSINDYASAKLLITPTDYVVQNDWVDINGVFRDIQGQGEDGEIWIGASSGPTQDERMGVDFAAPGEVCHAAYSPKTYYSNFGFNILQNSNGLYGIQNAVSAAAPLSTGIIALMLEGRPNLNPAEIRTILQQSCTQDEDTGTVPNNTWGYGKINALRTIENTLDVEAHGLVSATVFPNPGKGRFTLLSERNYPDLTLVVYDIFGRRLFDKKYRGNGPVNFTIDGPSGIYFVKLIAPNETMATLTLVNQ